MTAVNFTIFCIGAALCGLELYASGTTIHAIALSAKASVSCADKSMPTAKNEERKRVLIRNDFVNGRKV